MAKKDKESLKEYGQCLRGLTFQVEPPLSKRELVSMFMDTLQPPFVGKMIESVSSRFSDRGKD